MRLLCVDFETTGGNPQEHQAIQIGAFCVESSDLDVVSTFERKIRFDERYTWTFGAQRVHGITRTQLAKHAPIDVVGREIRAWLLENFGGEAPYGIVLLGQNVNFDRSFLHQLLAEAGEVQPTQWFRTTTVDTVGIGRKLWGRGASAFTFPKVGIHRTTHDALEDAEACLRICLVGWSHYRRALLAAASDSNRGPRSTSRGIRSRRSVDVAVDPVDDTHAKR